MMEHNGDSMPQLEELTQSLNGLQHKLDLVQSILTSIETEVKDKIRQVEVQLGGETTGSDASHQDFADRVGKAVRGLGQGENQKEILSSLLNQVGECADRAAIFLEEDGNYSPWRNFGFESEDLTLVTPDEAGNPIIRASQERETIYVSDGLEEALPWLRNGPPPRTAVCVPLSFEDYVPVVLYADSAEALEVNFLELLSELAVLVLKNDYLSRIPSEESEEVLQEEPEVEDTVEFSPESPSEPEVPEIVTLPEEHSEQQESEEDRPWDSAPAPVLDASIPEGQPDWAEEPLQMPESPVEVRDEGPETGDLNSEPAQFSPEDLPAVDTVADSDLEDDLDELESDAIDLSEVEVPEAWTDTEAILREASQPPEELDSLDEPEILEASEEVLETEEAGEQFEPEGSDEKDRPEAVTPEEGELVFDSDNEELLHKEADRFARLLVSEIKLYNENAVEQGRNSADLYDRLSHDIDRSREMYEKRADSSVKHKRDYFHHELVRVLAGGDESLLGVAYNSKHSANV
jgi:hypothetical protein